MKLFRFETNTQPLLRKSVYYKRIILHFMLGLLIISISLFIGVLGYHIFENLGWIDSLLNASMILGGMGPVNELKTENGKIFASFYALFSGIIFLVIIGVVIAPMFHRFLHKFHMDSESED